LDKVTNTVREWFSNANEDIRVAQALWDLEPEKYLRAVPYHCQQAAEKSIKGYLAYKKVKFPKTHDIGELATLVSAVNPEMFELLKEASALSPYAVEFRYPDATKKDRTIEDSRKALALGKKVFQAITALIPFDSQWEV
jgi:HEPN domain-containing protein